MSSIQPCILKSTQVYLRGKEGMAQLKESKPHALHTNNVARVPLPDVLVEAGGVLEHAPGRNREREGERGEGFVRGEARDPSIHAH